MTKKKATKQQREETEVIVILDRSGSMQSISDATVSGFNEFLLEQRGAEGKAFVTLVQFDDNYQIDYKNVPVEAVSDLINGETFVPRGMTAMLDAIGKTINEVKTDRDVVCVIITDGHENASREYSRDLIFKLIEKKTKKGWKFLFLGANQDAIKAGGELGINAGNAMNYSATVLGATTAFSSVSRNTRDYRSAKFNEVDLAQAAAELNFKTDQREEAVSDKG